MDERYAHIQYFPFISLKSWWTTKRFTTRLGRGQICMLLSYLSLLISCQQFFTLACRYGGVLKDSLYWICTGPLIFLCAHKGFNLGSKDLGGLWFNVYMYKMWICVLQNETLEVVVRIPSFESAIKCSWGQFIENNLLSNLICALVFCIMRQWEQLVQMEINK